MQMILAYALLAAGAAIAQTDSKSEVLKAEAAFNEGKIHNDTAALEKILAGDYLAVNQWGARRNKAQALELFKTFQITSLVHSRVNVRLVGDIALIDGIMDESGGMKFIFMRTYVKRQGRWLLLSSTQNFVMDENFKVYDPEVAYQQNQ